MQIKLTDIKNNNFLSIHGLVQGIGFRPYVYRLAKKYHINGFVRNTRNGAEVLFQRDQRERLTADSITRVLT